MSYLDRIVHVRAYERHRFGCREYVRQHVRSFPKRCD